jgi:hypothetical protein
MEYDGSLESLFEILENVCSGKDLPSHINRLPEGRLSERSSFQEDFFDNPKPAQTLKDSIVIDRLNGIAKELYEVSAAGYSNFVHAWMSEFLIEAEIIRFGFLLIQAARNAGKNSPPGTVSRQGREAAEITRNNRMDEAVKIVRDASFKVSREAHRLMGLLRFLPGSSGVLIAFCSPDHFILPVIAEHFTLRFGNTPWAIVDEKRGLALIKNIDAETEITMYNPDHPWFAKSQNAHCDEWESLWLSYFKAINNESRANPKIQLQFMPKRYWKYLPEVRNC